MYACRQYAYPPNAENPDAERAPWNHPFFRRGPPPIVAILGVGAAFMVFPPLGFAALAFVLWKARQARAWRGHGFARSGAGQATRNAVFDERRRETMSRLAEEAEAFNAFERRRGEARDREAFDHFMAERAAKPADAKPADPKPSDGQPSA
jgi:hypothetical protein